MKVERIKMTASMRYQVLVRDKATCQICGAGKKDGAILHVDHILPVAKGGKSTLDNLRTLCDLCNLGKKDRIEDPQSF
jgi:5-methylcytosine-specific restriction endonuclease McrA